MTEERSVEVQVAELSRDVQHLSEQISDFAEAVKKIVEYNEKLVIANKEIEYSQKDRENIWKEIDALKVAVAELKNKTITQITPDLWWQGQVTGWTSRFFWLLAGALVAWLAKWWDK